jgi:transcription antitermination factor NusG
MTHRWYCAQTQSGMGRTARDQLSRQTFEVFLPEIREFGEVVTMFPGYIFVAFDRDDDSVRWKSINGTRGVIKLLPLHCENPSPIKKGFVEELLKQSADGTLTAEKAQATALRYLRDDDVPIIAGAFAGYHGKMVRYRKGSLELLTALLGQEVVLAVPLHQVARKMRDAAF